MMINYNVVYVDDRGDKQDFVATAPDIPSVYAVVEEKCPDCRRIISCISQQNATHSN